MSSTEIELLNQRFAIPGVVALVAGNGGLTKLRITGPAASAELYLYGAQITAWQPVGATEVLFLSELSRWDPGKAIRGGIPVCFPWFRSKADNSKAPAHGFARTRAWELVSVEQASDGVAVTLTLTDDAGTRTWWPYPFRLSYRIVVGAALRLELTTTNVGDQTFQMEQALHSYYRVGSVFAVRVSGLDGVSYLDNTNGNSHHVQHGDVMLSRATDNAYLATESSVTLVDDQLRRSIRLRKQGSTTTVVWNPWQHGAQALADLGDAEWQTMACVEASNVLAGAVKLAAGATHILSANHKAPELHLRAAKQLLSGEPSCIPS